MTLFFGIVCVGALLAIFSGALLADWALGKLDAWREKRLLRVPNSRSIWDLAKVKRL
jgi:hypothetical protein